MQRYHTILAGLCLVMVVLAASSIVSAAETHRAAGRAARATLLSDIYQRARYSAGEEESLERKYRLEPGAAVKARHAAAAAALVDALHHIEEQGTRDDRALSSSLLATHTRYLEAMDKLFEAVDAGDDAAVLDVDGRLVDPLFGEIEAKIDEAATEHREQSNARLDALQRVDRVVLWVTGIVFTLGVALFVVFASGLVRIHEMLREQARASAHDALHDALTGLPNRVLFRDRLEHAIEAARREPAPFSTLMIDLDRFKEINDTLGHVTGDVLLREIGPRLASVTRPGDTVARLGGDEFGVLLLGADSVTARAVADRMNAALLEPFVLTGLTVAVGGSIGIVTYPTHGETPDLLLQRADVAMYLAKGQVHGQALYDPGADPYAPERLMLASDLRRAVTVDEFELHFQPKLTTDTFQLDGVEALVRWNHPERGLLPPSEFIPLAEHTGQIKQLTLCVLRQAARQHVAWREQGLEVKIAVNLSVANLLDLELLDDVAGVLRDEGLPAHWLELEITESTVMADPERALLTLDKLAAIGIDLSIDDFGTGHSSLAYLRKLPVRQLKIDRSFISDLADDQRSADIVRSTIELGHTLGLRVVAEGIEDQRALAMLQGFGCDLGQGFFLCRPAPAEVMLARLREFQRSRRGTDALAT